MKRSLIGRITLLCIAFYLYILGLLQMFPLWISIPILFAAATYLFRPINKKQRFKGYRSR